jgi:hypothetical protein
MPDHYSSWRQNMSLTSLPNKFLVLTAFAMLAIMQTDEANANSIIRCKGKTMDNQGATLYPDTFDDDFDISTSGNTIILSRLDVSRPPLTRTFNLTSTSNMFLHVGANDSQNRYIESYLHRFSGSFSLTISNQKPSQHDDSRINYYFLKTYATCQKLERML